MFTDVEFMSARDKELVYGQWKTFVKGLPYGDRKVGLRRFTERLYVHLHLHCGHIACFNKYGFYNTYFVEPESTLDFLHQFDEDLGCKSPYGDNQWITNQNYVDINTAMCRFFGTVKNRIYSELQDSVRANARQKIMELLPIAGIDILLG